MATRSFTSNMSSTEPYQPSRAILSRLGRRWTAAQVAFPVGRAIEDFFLSVSFDDAPVSAAMRGAERLGRRDLRATWYIASGLMGQIGAGGENVGPEHLRALAAAGHEIALHGHTHADMSRMRPEAALADITRNRDALAQILGQAPSPHFAWPYGTTRTVLKRRLAGAVMTARGVLPGVNGAVSDRMQLAAYDLRREHGTIDRAMAGMRQAARRGGWVILFTHDVTPDPGPFGIAPRVLEQLLDEAGRLGARILPVGEVWRRLVPAEAPAAAVQST